MLIKMFGWAPRNRKLVAPLPVVLGIKGSYLDEWLGKFKSMHSTYFPEFIATTGYFYFIFFKIMLLCSKEMS